MNRKLIYKTAILSVVLIAISFIAWAVRGKFLVHVKPSAKYKKDTKASPSIDPVLLAKYQAVFKKYDTIKKDITMSGTINIIDRADTSGNMKNVGFLFCKTGSDFYYKLGTTETINADGLYIFVDHLGHTIVVSPQKKVAYDVQPNAFADIGKEIRSDLYDVTGNNDGNLQTISLHNEHNINCKLFSISYDTATLAIRHMYARMTNLQDPARTDNEKLVDINITEWNDRGDLDKFYKKDIIARANGTWKVTDKYKDYQLTTLQ